MKAATQKKLETVERKLGDVSLSRDLDTEDFAKLNSALSAIQEVLRAHEACSA